MRKMRTTTQTASVTNTHVGIAVVLTMAIGGLAFAGVPAVKNNNKCGANRITTVRVLNCGSGMYSGANFTCFDGVTKQYRPGKCVNLSVLQSYGKNIACKNRCSNTPQAQKVLPKKVSPAPTPPPKPKPVAEKMPEESNFKYTPPVDYGYGYNE